MPSQWAIDQANHYAAVSSWLRQDVEAIACILDAAREVGSSSRDSERATLRDIATEPCRYCNGKGTRTTDCSYCGDSTFDHECNDRVISCTFCDATGRSPSARKAVAILSDTAK